ncbi:terminase small subunit : Terminase small subunit OS=Gemmatimonadetes bacterium KBS708 GN=J421_4674 PE=4 SV=1: Terminase_2 [Gemmataceae bacterium]|nr:terminase small subunit : Terminase small subunit OS=Gemmatimonadetes bacterium KBS708 GN=J421_4674 PE=4 SV=1: Terminase_2 [Gemmataceae bacterium]VTT96552.1 terminase small subunit : Terminase small subunit OS=Gemmatimonadetes bacterium KBS708 GN=J421_4674 PE=4 SV=1: Terminase_2 [Gemmataceae bacterium]
MALTPKQQRFAEEYLADLNATQAAVRAGYSAKTARQIGDRLLTNVDIAAEIARLQQARGERTRVTADQVLLRWWQLATADPNELIEHRRTCCRYCHGAGFRYQRTAGELDTARRAHEAEARKPRRGKPPPEPFDDAGGSGYDARKPPHPGCPECFGEGVGAVFAKDTRRLSPAALALYAGVKQTKDGFEVKVHDQAAALANVARHLGMFVERHEHTGAGGGPVQHEHSLTSRIDQLAAAFEGAADRAGEGGPPGDGAGEPVDPGEG